MNDLDLEELETHLYNQVYHSLDDETEQTNSNIHSGKNTISKPTNGMKLSGARYFGPWSPTSRYQNKHGPPRQNNSKTVNRLGDQYRKNYSKPHSSEFSVNQVVVSPKRPIVGMTAKEKKAKERKERNKARWKAKMQEKARQKRAVKRAQKAKQTEKEAVITLSDSEDDSCILIDNKWPVLSVVDSDDEKATKAEKENLNGTLKNVKSNVANESCSDDVIFVEPVVAPIEIINIDEDTVLEKSGVENVSISSDNTSINKLPHKELSPQQLHQERKELLSTPDSASNDFMNSSGIELNQRKFNFSLHGSDFRNGGFLKPAPRNETCETESSSSTTDVNSVNLMQTAVFSEIDFPKDDIFSENNLESFGNFITPLRKNVPATTNLQSTPVRPSHDQSKNLYSDSSSESELEESQTDRPKLKHLPELSPMQSKKEAVSCLAKNPKKPSGKSETVIAAADCTVTDSNKNKKKKKKKKSNSLAGDTEEDSTLVTDSSFKIPENDEGQNRKKRKSSQLDCTESSDSKSRKKMSNSAGDLSVQELNSADNAPDVENQVEKKKPEGDKNEKTDQLKQSQGQSPEQSKDSIQNVNDSVKQENLNNSLLAGLVVVDETFSPDVNLISDTESVLSALNEQSDIQLNCDQRQDSQTGPVSSLDNFSVRAIQTTMSNDPKLWVILDCDKTPSGRIKGRRCNKCKQWGHMAIRCPNKVEVKCSLCGRPGHFEPRCPNKICTQCGQRSPYATTYCNSCFKLRNFICQICSMVGHLPDACPDLWRRYHMTTSEGPPKVYEGPPLKGKNDLWCSGCAQSGHLEHSCRFYKPVYPSTYPYVKHYDDVYENEPMPSNSNEAKLQIIPPRQNYGMNQMYPVVDQRHIVGPSYNQNNYGQMNPQFVNPFMDRIFVASQQNFFPAMSANVLQYPQNQYSGGNNQIVFESVLPNYISFDSKTPSNNDYHQVPNDNYSEVYIEPDNKTNKASKAMKQNNSMFFSSSTAQLQHFIAQELHRLSKLGLLSNKLIREIRKRQVPTRDTRAKEEYYESLNMLLFGIFKKVNGRTELEKLKRFSRDGLRSRVNNRTRRQLLQAYCYIFGRDKHYGIDYDDLLRKTI